ncbi:uncharacterized protein N7479_008312 [Penicillium vulpinum]|uniref:uncharacterized protein n=1 Tax=Penicillium vulpinum TaxID=29845 RepID=UPI002549858E|nr:uncharacterized protein N7479_008312 [Penicillium vulpinum]KAJ5961162.1 hypothetical protein N7479_008312 [Penicillium vulpinum]
MSSQVKMLMQRFDGIRSQICSGIHNRGLTLGSGLSKFAACVALQSTDDMRPRQMQAGSIGH